MLLLRDVLLPWVIYISYNEKASYNSIFFFFVSLKYRNLKLRITNTYPIKSSQIKKYTIYDRKNRVGQKHPGIIKGS